MSGQGISNHITALLEATTALGGYTNAFVCTHDGLVVAAAGDVDAAEQTAAVVSLFDDVLVRARRDLAFSAVDEVTLLEPRHGWMVIRPLKVSAGPPFFLVVRVPPNTRWRRNTNILLKRLMPILEPLASDAET
ncbi:MAG: hypothetical protein H6737_14945 [Alphaproteobacteria bacterium]|nr:hypothetical protein [Alphaproteobacteria bacterium]